MPSKIHSHAPLPCLHAGTQYGTPCGPTLAGVWARTSASYRPSPSCMCGALLSPPRACMLQRDPDMLPTPLNVHRLLISGVMLAAKLTDDHYFNNAFYGRVSAPGADRVRAGRMTTPPPRPALALAWLGLASLGSSCIDRIAPSGRRTTSPISVIAGDATGG
jgi:hypothetical protein